MKKISVIVSCLCLLVAQTTYGEWVWMAPGLPTVSNIKVGAGFKPALKASSFIIPPAGEVVTKEMWIGNLDLSFHVQARETLKVVKGYPIGLNVGAGLKPALDEAEMRSLLIAITREQKSHPLSHNILGIRLTHKAA